MKLLLENDGFKVEKEITKSINFQNEQIGVVRIDLLVNSEIILELKSIMKITNKEINQLKRYLKVFNCKEGYLINVNYRNFEIIKINHF